MEVARVRVAEASDLDAVIGIAQACFGASAWGAAHFAPHPARKVYVAELGSAGNGRQTIGYCVLECIADEAELQALAVRAEYRRQGIGQALLAAARERALGHGARELFLEVRESNRNAQAFYRHFGFDFCGLRPGYYRSPDEAAVLMRAELR